MNRNDRGRFRLAVGAGLTAGLAIATVPALGASAEEAAPNPKNIIVMISDGAGYNHFDSANLFETGTSLNQVAVDPATGAVTRGERVPTQVYDSWPVQVGQSTHSTSGRAAYDPEASWADFDWQRSGATDSAAAGTALGTGVKTNNGTIGFDPEGNRLLTVGEQAKEVGKKVGLVTSVPFNHATPATFIAHNANRNDYQGLATEMIDSGIDVIMGAGHPYFTRDNRSRAADWKWISQADFERVSGGQTDFEFIERKGDFTALAEGQDVPEKVFGLPQVAETLQYSRQGNENSKNVLPGTDRFNDVTSLEVMTQGALNVLEQDEDGFFLMVEGGAVDWAGHDNHTTRLIEEQQDFNASVEAVNAWIEENSSWDETLVIITADHETGSLQGPGAGPEGWTQMSGEAGKLPNLSWHSGNHTNQLVPVFANGAGSERLAERADMFDQVRGAYLDNTDIGEVIFDILGLKASDDANSVPVHAHVDTGKAPAGALALTVAEGSVHLRTSEGGTDELPNVEVNDSRNEVQAQGRGWTVAGSAKEFRAGNRTFGAEALWWQPKVVSTDNGATAGPEATLEAPANLADTDRTTRVGTSVLSADLKLNAPEDARQGDYGSQISLTLFAKD